jgi:hypothetical protein
LKVVVVEEVVENSWLGWFLWWLEVVRGDKIVCYGGEREREKRRMIL